MRLMNWLRRGLFVAAALGAAVGAEGAGAGSPLPTLVAPFDEDYTMTNLGSVPGLPTQYAGMAFLPGQPNTLLIGGLGNEEDAAVYTVELLRDGSGRITGFAGDAEHFADAPYIDGGLVYYDSVLFYSRYQSNVVEIGQISDATHKVMDLEGLGVAEAAGGLNVVPPGYPGAGRMKLASYSDGAWYELALQPDGTGTFNVTSATFVNTPSTELENFVYVPMGSPQFGTNPSLLINEYDTEAVSAFESDVNGDPIPGSRQPFLTNVLGPDGSVIDPLTGDLLISDYSDDRVYKISGFAAFIQGDNDCDNDVDGGDALIVFRHESGAGAGQPGGCRPLGEYVGVAAAPAGNGAPVYGDGNCDFAVTVADGMVILRYLAGLLPGIPDFCTPPGAPFFIPD